MPSVPGADLEHILAHTSGLWEAIRGQNIFVTGGTGFFGRWIVESFAFANERLALGAHMTVLTRDPAAFARKASDLARNPSLSFVAGDVRSLRYQGILRYIPSNHSGRFPFIIHAATESVGQTDPISTFNTIVNGTRAVLDFALASGTRRFLFTSSGAIYGTQPSDITHIPETYSGAPDCTRATSVYGEGKRAAEVLCAAYHSRYPALEPVFARCFAFVGPFLALDAHFAVGNFIRDAMVGGPIRIGGDGTPSRSYLHASDLAIWLWTLLLRGQAARAYNVGSEEDVTILKLAQTVAECFPSPTAVTVAQESRPDVPPSRYVPSTRLAADELGLKCLLPLAEAISRTVTWHREASPSSPPEKIQPIPTPPL
jgi:dTDP-glucose 4,6-dehydratase